MPILRPQCLCETQKGDLAYTLGRIIFKPGRPMLVEHIGNIYLEHDLSGRVITPGAYREYDIVSMHCCNDNEIELSPPDNNI